METNVDFIKDLARHPKFQSGDVHTGFIEENYDSLFPNINVTEQTLTQGALALILEEDSFSSKDAHGFSPFTGNPGLRLNHALERRFDFVVRGKNHAVTVKYVAPGKFLMRADDGPWKNVSGSATISNNVFQLHSEIDGVKTKARVVNGKGELYLFTNVSWGL